MKTFVLTGKLVCILCAATAFAQFVPAQSRLPQFKDYAVTEVHRGRNARLALTRKDREFKTRLTWAVEKERPNFAGHYILTRWGCGSGCVMGAIIDAKTGRVYWWDFTICCWGFDVDDEFKPIEFRLDSRLIVFSGVRDEKDGDAGAHFYKFEKGRFVHIKSVPKKVTSGL